MGESNNAALESPPEGQPEREKKGGEGEGGKIGLTTEVGEKRGKGRSTKAGGDRRCAF